MKKHYDIDESKYLSHTELEELTSSLQSDRDSLIMRLLLETGARSQELLNVSLSDIDMNSRTILIRGLKGSQDRRLPIKEATYKYLVNYIKTTAIDHILFDITTRRLRQIWDYYKPSKKGIHSLRHTFALNLYVKTKDVLLVKAALGHRSINSTMAYAEYIYKKDQLIDRLREVS